MLGRKASSWMNGWKCVIRTLVGKIKISSPTQTKVSIFQTEFSWLNYIYNTHTSMVTWSRGGPSKKSRLDQTAVFSGWGWDICRQWWRPLGWSEDRVWVQCGCGLLSTTLRMVLPGWILAFELFGILPWGNWKGGRGRVIIESEKGNESRPIIIWNVANIILTT